MPIKLPFRPRQSSFPPDLWTQCPTCGEMLYNKQLERAIACCGKCGHHFRLRIAERLETIVDADSFTERDAGLEIGRPARLRGQQGLPGPPGPGARIHRRCGCSGLGHRHGRRPSVSICVMDFAFMGGSMGSVSGEKVTLAAEAALATRVPLIVVSASGGARVRRARWP